MNRNLRAAPVITLLATCSVVFSACRNASSSTDSSSDGSTTAAPPIAALPAATVPPTSTPDPFATRGAPARLEIPAIDVATDLESLSPNESNQIGAPRDWQKAGWYDTGFYPGEPGSAVITGHLDTDSGAPAVFWRLKEMQRGDRLTVAYPNGDRFVFEVEEKKLVDADTVVGDAYDRLFAPSDDPRLSLITCDGAWDHGRATYSKRLIVFTRLVVE